jgi:hypothetical protein
MTRLLFVVALLFCSNVFATDYIRVVGEGVTLEIAKEHAFREAVQIRAGTIVLSEREITIRKIVLLEMYPYLRALIENSTDSSMFWYDNFDL